LIAKYTNKRLSDSDIANIRASVQLTAKAPTIYEVMHVNVFVMETYKVMQDKLKRSKTMDAKTFSTVADLFFGYDKMPRLNYK
jgi:hypothetical protein